jgi:hypothetical protein
MSVQALENEAREYLDDDSIERTALLVAKGVPVLPLPEWLGLSEGLRCI